MTEAAVLSARWKAAEDDHAGAIAVLEDAAKRLPSALGVRVALSHAHIAESPPEVLVPAFRSILELDPHNDQAKRNLKVLYRKTGRCRGCPRRRRTSPNTTLLEILRAHFGARAHLSTVMKP